MIFVFCVHGVDKGNCKDVFAQWALQVWKYQQVSWGAFLQSSVYSGLK